MSLASPTSKPEDFNRPGHIFPLKYKEGGVLKRAGHTEASVDLATLAGLPPVAVLCEIVDDDDGSMARLPKLREFAKREGLKIISIADLIRYVLFFEVMILYSGFGPHQNLHSFLVLVEWPVSKCIVITIIIVVVVVFLP